METESRLDVHHVVLEATLDDTVVLEPLVTEPFPGIVTHAMQGQDLDAHGVLGVAGDDHATFPGHQVLRDVEAEAPECPERPRPPTMVFGLDGVGAILDNGEPAARGNLHD